ncbi:MAG: hypothetical protein SFU86_21850 [Pirellulaceae bacterium]|nr:hypothetical protein [Pirellulaceae bacterium]
MSSPAPVHSPPQQPPKRTTPLGVRLMMWMLFLVLVGPCVAVLAPREVSQWYLAAANEDWKAGRHQQAEERWDKALAWTSSETDKANIYFSRAAVHKEAKNYERALADLDRAKAIVPEFPPLLLERSVVLQHLGRHREAIADLLIVDRLSQISGRPTRPEALNALAYARAVGNLDLEAGLAQANEALQFEPNSAMILDTRGFLLHRLGKEKEALADLETAVSDFERLAKKDPSDPVKQGLAVMLYHRALVLQKLDRAAEAQRDLARVKELIGREADAGLF